MSKKLIALGHGRSKTNVYDSGAKGNGTTEAEFLRGSFLTSLKKYAKNKIDFYEKNMFANREADTIKGYDEVIELHLDAASPTAKGGHVIIYKDYKPDAMDNRIGEVIKKHFGLRGNKMFDNRNDLYNLNVFTKRKIAYRLVELCFITNKANMDYFKKNVDLVAKELVEAILNEKIEEPKQQKGKYIVKKGDTLNGIAKEHKITLAQLMTVNKQIKDKDKIAIDDVINIPQKQVYVVKMGDTLSGIANRYKVSLEDVMKENKHIKNASLIYVGNKITIPLK